MDPKHLSEPPLPEGPRGFLAPSVDVRGFHKTLEPSQIRPWHNYIPLPRNGLYYLNTNITGKKYVFEFNKPNMTYLQHCWGTVFAWPGIDEID